MSYQPDALKMAKEIIVAKLESGSPGSVNITRDGGKQIADCFDEIYKNIKELIEER